jgi:hypothetical protein
VHNLIRADALTLRHSIGVRVSALTAVLAAGGYLLLAHLIATGTLDESASNSASALSDVMVVYLLGSLLVGMLVAGDFETRTIHDALLASSRATLVGAKTVGLLAVVTLLVAPYGLATLLGFVSGTEFAAFMPTTFLDVVANEQGLAVDAGSVAKVAGIVVVTTLVYVARLSFCLPVAFAAKRPVAVMAVGFGGNFLLDFLAALAVDVPGLGTLVELTPFGPSHTGNPTLPGSHGSTGTQGCILR